MQYKHTAAITAHQDRPQLQKCAVMAAMQPFGGRLRLITCRSSHIASSIDYHAKSSVRQTQISQRKGKETSSVAS